MTLLRPLFDVQEVVGPSVPIHPSRRDEEVPAPPCHVENSVRRDEEVSAPPCHVKISFRHDEEVPAPPCHVENSVWRDEEVSAPPCHVKISFRHDEEVPAPPCHAENPFRRDEEVFSPPCHVDNLFSSRSRPLHLRCRGFCNLNNFRYFIRIILFYLLPNPGTGRKPRITRTPTDG
jgi:hypothetical protein